MCGASQAPVLLVSRFAILPHLELTLRLYPPQEVSQNLSHMKDKWGRVPDASGSPDLDNLDYDQYTSSLQK